MSKKDDDKLTTIEDLLGGKKRLKSLIQNAARQSKKGPPKIQVSSLAVKQKLQEKQEEIAIKQREKITAMEAARIGVSYINLKGFPIGPDTISIVPKKTAKEMNAICFLHSGKEIRLGVVDLEITGLDNLIIELEDKHYAHVVVYLISKESFKLAYKVYDYIVQIKDVKTGVRIDVNELAKLKKDLQALEQIRVKLPKLNLTDQIHLIVAGALQFKASDVHIEPDEKKIIIRFRIDGVLHIVADLPIDGWRRLISRVKVLSKLKININTIPQDGRFTIALEDKKIEVRVSTLPTAYGESIVMRILGGEDTRLDMEDLGFQGVSWDIMKNEATKPNGMIITTGPTGSGKTTTLYAILNRLNNPETKIITLEDPVEYKLPGINQSQVDPSKGYSFSKGLRSILRQDPDIVMVGEIRDFDTAETAINAALTGHLVVSTLHTNSAAAAIPRFVAMGVKPFLLAPALNVIIAQRLVRKLCPHCQEEHQMTDFEKERIDRIMAQISQNKKITKVYSEIKFYQGKGCEKCNGLGYKGRIGIYEVLPMHPEIEKVILSGNVAEYEMREIARKTLGMVTMLQDGVMKALDKVTSLEEVFRVASE